MYQSNGQESDVGKARAPQFPGISINLFLLYCGSAFLLSVTFIFFPNIDLSVSSLFGSESGFPLADLQILKIVRGTMVILTDGLMILVLALLILQLIWRSLCVIDRRTMAFVVASYVVGPGLIVNGVMKDFFGRARPNQIENFGGQRIFSPAFVPSDQCERYCSFVSGEASALASVAMIVLLVVVPHLPKSRRLFVSVAVLIVAVAGSTLRIVFGAHFLSDVIFAWLISIAVVRVLFFLFGMEGNNRGLHIVK